VLPDGSIAIFSRNSENNTQKYPDLCARLREAFVDVKSCILDCEVVAFDKVNNKILPFQILSTRKRKAVATDDIKVDVCIYAFDLLYLNDKSLLREPFVTRRDLMNSHFREVHGEFVFAKHKDSADPEDIQTFLNEAIQQSCEGLMVKTLEVEATYEPDKRSHNWLKVKKDYLEGVGDTLDLVPIGGYHGKGKRTGVYGAYLMACYDQDTEEYQSICKIGTGFSDEQLESLATSLNEQRLDAAPVYYKYPEQLACDVWFSPSQVWEVLAADLSISPAHKAALGLVDDSRGIALRFPRLIRKRDDKGPEDATSAEQVADMYRSQANRQDGDLGDE
jgi:DNA ligase-1